MPTRNGKGLVSFWRGTRKAYNELGTWDYWTRYTVTETDGRRVEYFGTNPINYATGELYPVLKKLASLEGVTLNVGDRYLVGKDGTSNETAEWYVVEIAADTSQSTINPLGNHSVRVMQDENGATDGKTYKLIDGVLTTFDFDGILDCGTF